MDPAEAAQAAGAEAAGAATATGEAAQGAVGGGGAKGMLGKLFDGTARGPPVQTLMQQLGLSRGQAMLVRGTMRVADAEGVPPIAEIIMGAVYMVLEAQPDGQGGTGGGRAERDTEDARENTRGDDEGSVGDVDQQLREGEL